jgi:hypothetical protein
MSTEDPQSTQKKRPRWLLPVSIVAVIAIVIAGVGIVFGLTSPTSEPSSSPTATATTSATPTPSATPPAPIPADTGVNYAPASFPGWTVANVHDSDTRFSANRDTVQDGTLSLRVDRPIPVAESARALEQTLAVTPGTTYDFSAWVKWPTSNSESAPVTLTMGTGGPKVIEFPTGTAEWTQVTSTYKTGAGQTSLPVVLEVSGATVGFMIDQIQLVATGTTTNLLANPSFEESAGLSNQVMNETLLLTTGSAGVNIAWNTASVDWTVADQSGAVVRSGAGGVVGGHYRVALDDLPQGYYDLSFTPSGASRVASSIIVLDATADGSIVTDQRFGVGAHVEEPYYNDSATAAAAVGVSSIRNDAYWNSTEKSAGQYAFPEVYNTAFAQFVEAGLAPLPISNGTNKLYDGGKIPTSPSGIQAYANYTAALADQYDLESVEIFNELNTQRFNNSTCGVGADCYFPLLKAAFEKVKAVSPSTKVLGPANGNQDDPFLTELYRIGGLNYLDAVTYHPYVAVPELLAPDIQAAQARIAEYNNGNAKPIWLTEFGWTASGGLSEATQANYLVRAEVIALASGIERLFWYDLVNDEVDGSHEGNFGLFRRETAVLPFEPKPAAMAQALLIRKVHEKDFASMDAVPNAYSYVYGAGDGATRVAWSTAGASVSYAATGPVTITTAMGTATTVDPVDGVVTVQLGEEPMYVEGPVTAATAPVG